MMPHDRRDRCHLLLPGRLRRRRRQGGAGRCRPPGRRRHPLGDDEYDAQLRAATAHEDAHPDQVLPDSPTGEVAGGVVVGDIPQL
ncbi:hypothetical protein [Kitasatospora sp. NPDC057500]|uniref:hypothetical protein n=1 Tax=Kitasatospora sp. NPDC057500 TaxID=3346151 RepID=UPI0036C60C29